jgi:hypothetical protein
LGVVELGHEHHVGQGHLVAHAVLARRGLYRLLIRCVVCVRCASVSEGRQQ